MAKDVISRAWNCMCCRNFSEAVTILEAKSEIYENDFEFYILLAIAFLYIGDFGSASSNLQKARRIKMTDTQRALQYYLDVKDYEPSNKIADKAIEFIRHNNDFDEICRYFETGKIQQFYPPLGPNPHKKFYVIVPVVAFILGAAITFCFIPKQNYNGKRKNLEALALTSVEKENLQEKDLTSQSFNYILSSKDISKSYKNAIDYFQSSNDNLAQREINRLLNSNASFSVKQKCQVLMSYLEVPTFDSLKDNFSYKQVAEEPLLYLDCWVVWSGRLSNSTVNPDGSYSCQLLVGYENMKTVDGIVNVHFDKEPALLSDQAVKILGQIDFEDSNVVLKGKAVYQSVKK